MTCTSYRLCSITPELPRSSPGGSGILNSTCNWQSPNNSRVNALPEPGMQTKQPSATVHLVASPFSSHQFREIESGVPSKRTIASDGTPPSGASIFGGSGRCLSCTAHACLASGRSPIGTVTSAIALATVQTAIAANMACFIDVFLLMPTSLHSRATISHLDQAVAMFPEPLQERPASIV